MVSRVYLGLVPPFLHPLSGYYVGSICLPLAGTMVFCLIQCQQPQTETFAFYHFPQVAVTELHAD